MEDRLLSKKFLVWMSLWELEVLFKDKLKIFHMWKSWIALLCVHIPKWWESALLFIKKRLSSYFFYVTKNLSEYVKDTQWSPTLFLSHKKKKINSWKGQNGGSFLEYYSIISRSVKHWIRTLERAKSLWGDDFLCTWLHNRRLENQNPTVKLRVMDQIFTWLKLRLPNYR